jgi:hypothetical protein
MGRRPYGTENSIRIKALKNEERPQLGIDWFINTFRDDLTILHQNLPSDRSQDVAAQASVSVG